MNKTTVPTKTPPIEKEKVIAKVKSLIADKTVKLNTKYLHSHSKVALMVEGHIIEICGSEGRQIRYETFNVPLTAKEHKEIMDAFLDEVKKRKEHDSIKKLEELKAIFRS